MKPLRTLTSLLAALSLLAACSTTEPPEAVAEKFEKAMIGLDFETAKAYATNDIISWITIVKMGISANDIDRLKEEAKHISVRVGEVTYVNDKKAAIVNIEVFDGDSLVDRKERYLVKKDGRWLVTTHWLIPG